jgi:methionyl-tRNA formyltransferase
MGQAAFGEAVFNRLVEDGHEIAGVSAPAAEGARPDALWAAAESADMPIVPTAALKNEEGLGQWRGWRAELCVMAFVTEIVPMEALTAPKLGTIQYHPSLLPLHRGASAMNWAIINGDTETGLSIFWPDRGIDTGPILLQKRVEITSEDTLGTLYFGKLFPMGVDAMSEAVALVAAGKAPRIEQDQALGTYEPICGEEHAQIAWYAPAERLSALIRGCNPSPGAWTTFEGQRLRIFDCQLLGKQAEGMPGTVLRVDEDGFDVRLNGDVLHIARVQAEGRKKMPAGEWAEGARLKQGFRFR